MTGIKYQQNVVKILYTFNYPGFFSLIIKIKIPKNQ